MEMQVASEVAVQVMDHRQYSLFCMTCGQVQIKFGSDYSVGRDEGSVCLHLSDGMNVSSQRMMIREQVSDG